MKLIIYGIKDGLIKKWQSMTMYGSDDFNCHFKHHTYTPVDLSTDGLQMTYRYISMCTFKYGHSSFDSTNEQTHLRKVGHSNTIPGFSDSKFFALAVSFYVKCYEKFNHNL